MMLLKSTAKKILKSFYKLLIMVHKNGTVNYKNVDDALYELNCYYPYKEYPLINAVNNINEYRYDLSIIVPVFNSSAFLNKCLKSLLNQKTSYTYEIICVDDGSTDDSLQILNRIDDLKLKVVHQENKGIAGARNTGLNLSTGKYVGFVDNDDFVSDEYVERLMEEAFKNDADYVKCGYKVIDDRNGKVIEETNLPDLIMDDSSEFEDNYEAWLHGFMWGGCYKRNLWEGFCFPEGFWYEDIVKNIYIYGKCRKFINIKEQLYIKRKHNNNAADNLWKKNNSQCLDQLYLVMNLSKLNNDNIMTYYAQLSELGEYLYKRTRNLPSDIKKDAFIVACDLVFHESLMKLKNTNFEIIKTQEALVSKDYALWELVGKYCCY